VPPAPPPPPGELPGGGGTTPHAPIVQVSAQQSPKFAQDAPCWPQPILPPQVPLVQSLLQQSAEDAQMKPSGVHVGRRQRPDAQLPLQQSAPVVHIALAPLHDAAFVGVAQVPEQDVLQHSSQDRQLVPIALHVAATAPSGSPASGTKVSPPVPVAQLRTTTAAATESADHDIALTLSMTQRACKR
jgi:hypothetical protein